MYRVIFKHYVKPGQKEEFQKRWKAGSDLIQTYPGSLGTKLFQSEESNHILYAMAEWESLEHRNSAMTAISSTKDGDYLTHFHEECIEKYEIVAAGTLIDESIS